MLMVTFRAYGLRGMAKLIDPFIGVDHVDERGWLQLSATQIRRRESTPSASDPASHTLLSEAGVLGAVLPLATRPFSSSRKVKRQTSCQRSE